MMAESSDITMTPGLFLTHSDNRADTEELCGNLCINAASRRENSVWCGQSCGFHFQNLNNKSNKPLILKQNIVFDMILGEACVNYENQSKRLTGCWR